MIANEDASRPAWVRRLFFRDAMRIGLLVFTVLLLAVVLVAERHQEATVYTPGNGVTLPKIVTSVAAASTRRQ